MTTTPARYRSQELAAFVAGVLGRYGLPEQDARLGAGVLLDADLTGVDTHGVANFATHDHYARGLRSGAVSARPQVTVLRDSAVAAAWDSGGGFGPVIAHRAMTAAIAKARASGIGMVTVRHSRHFGANGYFAELAARAGLVAMVSANTPVSGIPPGALRPVVGPNPFAFAAPAGPGAPPLVLDISMTAASGSKVNRARVAGEPVPLGWVVDAGGAPTTDAAASRNGGGLELLGGQVAGHKGYALALMVDTLAILAGNGPGLRQSPVTWTQGQWFAAWRLDLFVDPDEFAAQLRRLADDVHEVPTRDGGHVLLPGERRAACRAGRLANGIPLPDDVVTPLRALAGQAGVPFPDPISSQPEPTRNPADPRSSDNRKATLWPSTCASVR